MTFGDGGVVLVPVAARGTSVVALSDGRVVVVAMTLPVAGRRHLLLARLRGDGTLDPSFGKAGIADYEPPSGAPPYTGAPAVLAEQRDAKLLIATQESGGEGGDLWVVMRRLGDGAPDPSFNGGQVEFGFAGLTGSFDTSSTLAPASIGVESDGRILVSGTVSATASPPPRGQVYAVARLLADAGSDPTFAAGRSALVVSTRPTNDAPGVLALAPDDSFVVAGGSVTPDSGATSRYDLSAARVTANGSLDPSFADGGRLVMERDGSSQALAAAFDPNGRIVLAGYLSEDLAVFRVTSKGDVDSTFGDGGVLTLDVDGGVDVAKAVFAQADGRVLVAGSTRAGATYQATLARYMPSGAPDPTFGSDGVAIAPLVDASAASVVESAAVDRCHVVTVGSQGSDAGTSQAVVVARWRR